MELTEYLDFKTIEQKYGIRADALRLASRTGRLKTTQVGGKFGTHLCLECDLKKYLKDYPMGRKKKKPRLMKLK